MELTFKINLIGDSCSGKTEIMLKYVDGYFPESHIATIGVEFKNKLIKIGKFNITLYIWDTSGQERYRSITKNFLSNVDGVLFIYDITNNDSFANIKDWIHDFRCVESSEREITSIICGNRVDLEDQRQVSTDSLKQFGLRINMPTFEISSKTGYNINEAFEKLVHLIMENKTDEELIKQYGPKLDLINENELKVNNKQKDKNKNNKKKEENKNKKKVIKNDNKKVDFKLEKLDKLNKYINF